MARGSKHARQSRGSTATKVGHQRGRERHLLERRRRLGLRALQLLPRHRRRLVGLAPCLRAALALACEHRLGLDPLAVRRLLVAEQLRARGGLGLLPARLHLLQRLEQVAQLHLGLLAALELARQPHLGCMGCGLRAWRCSLERS